MKIGFGMGAVIRACWASACLIGAAIGLVAPSLCRAQLVVNDTLNGTSSSYGWRSIDGACLTAGNGSGSIPSCFAEGRIRTPDAVGFGALRLTDARNDQSGGLISTFTFPSDQGLQVTFTTVTYGGNGLNGTGADGLSFFLADADILRVVDRNTRLGAKGGSLGYSRSRGGVPGLVGGYLGVGIDEFGNYSNPQDTGLGGPGFRSNVVAVRGAQATGYRYIAGSAVQGAIASWREPTRLTSAPLTFLLSISRDGLLNMSYSRAGGVANPVISNLQISANNGPLPRNFRFGFAASTGGGTNIHEITCFKAAGITASGSSAGSNALQSSKVQLGTQLYLAYYHSENWWGQLLAKGISVDPVTQSLSINAAANWDASCTLTGGPCPTTGTATQAQTPDARVLLTSNGTQGVALLWNQLSATQRTALEGSATAAASARLAYLRGDRRSEGAQAGGFRPRTGLLGDILNSSPVAVGPVTLPPTSVWKDSLYPTASSPEGESYAAFSAQQATRTNVVYVGANDGYLHGFRAGAYDANAQFNRNVPNDGLELIAYVPATVLQTLHAPVAQLDFSGSQYAHNAYVDAAPGVGDLFYQGAWHTWLVSGLGAGGNLDGVIGNENRVGSGAIFALDVTDPARFSANQAAQLVIGEWSASNLVCEGDTGNSRCRDHLGNTYGTPLIRRLHDGNWAVIFGNGYHSPSGGAGVFILKVDSATGQKTVRYLDTGRGNRQTPNGIAGVTSLDINGDGLSDFLYAGDLLGNVWRFDVTSDQPANWRVRAEPIFQTDGLPISTVVLASAVKSAEGPARIMLNFGTGLAYPQTLSQAPSLSAQNHALVGVWDWDMDGWNTLGSRELRSLARSSPLAPPRLTMRLRNLQERTLFTDGRAASTASVGSRTVAEQALCWVGGALCTGNPLAPQFGWRLALPAPQEQVIYNPVVQDGLMVVSTTIPSVVQVFSCSPPKVATGFTMALTLDQGQAASTSYFDPNAPTNAGLRVIGVSLSAVGTPTFLVSGNLKYMVTQTSNGTPTLTQLKVPVDNPLTKRVTWRELR